MWWLKVVDKDLCLWLKYKVEKRREKPLKEKRYLYYIYNNLYVHVRNSVDDIDDIDDNDDNENLLKC